MLAVRFGGGEEVQVVAAGRDQQKLEAVAKTLPGLVTAQVDVSNAEELRTALVGSHIVVNCVGPYIATGRTIAKAALEAGVAYFDLASEQEHYRRLESLNGAAKKSGVLLLAGLGAYPGLSGLMLSALLDKHPHASSAELALVTGHPRDEASGGAVIASALLELRSRQERLTHGRLAKCRPGTRRTIDFGPPFETVQLMEWPQLEVLAFANHKHLQELSCWIAVDGQRPTRAGLLRAIGLLPFERSPAMLRTLVAAVKAARRGPVTASDQAAIDWGAVHVGLSGEFGSISQTVSVDGLGAATAWLPVYAVSAYLGGRLQAAGLKLPHEVFNGGEVVDALRREPNVRWGASKADAASSSSPFAP